MTGVLHRLAAQALGSGGTVRSAARLAFLGAPGLVERNAPADRSPEAPVASPRQDEHTDFAPSTRLPVGLATREPNATAGSIARREASLGIKPPAQAAPTESRPVVRREPKVIEPEPPARMPTEIGVGRAPEPRRSAPSDTGKERDSSEAMPPVPLRTRFPEPLLPAQTVPVSAVAPRTDPSVGASLPERSARRDEGGDVHVTIGLIELTAVHEAPRVKPSAPRQAPQLTLDDYLARRRGGRR